MYLQGLQVIMSLIFTFSRKHLASPAPTLLFIHSRSVGREVAVEYWGKILLSSSAMWYSDIIAIYVTLTVWGFFSLFLFFFFSFFFYYGKKPMRQIRIMLNNHHRLVDYWMTYLLKKKYKKCTLLTKVVYFLWHHMIAFSFLLSPSCGKLSGYNQSFSPDMIMLSCSAMSCKYKVAAVLQQIYTEVALSQLRIWLRSHKINESIRWPDFLV